MSRRSTLHSTGSIRGRVLHAEVRFSRQRLDSPLVLSSGVIEALTQAEAVVRYAVGSQEVEGRGCIYLSDLWAWPDAGLTHETRDAAMREYCQLLATALPSMLGDAMHPLVAGLRLHDHALHCTPATMIVAPPTLARSVCMSIFDAAIHDAAGRALGRCAFDLYDDDFAVEEADAYFGGEYETSRAIRELLEHSPRSSSPAWWVIGKGDDLESVVRPKVERYGYYAFKIKIHGRDPQEDVARLVEISRAAQRWGIDGLRLSIDSNEANPDASSVLRFLDLLESADVDAYHALEMIEQPTGRDIKRDAFDWSGVAARKPVMVDEGLLSLEAMRVARRQHWSGFAIKTCKGHSFALTAAAWAHRHGMMVSLQDLTNPGASMVHAALFAARVPTLNGVELNSPQFTPAANAGWSEAYPGLFEVRDGKHVLPPADTLGLGGVRA